MMVQSGSLKGQARAFSTLARLYEETKQLTKAHDYYKKVGCASTFDSLLPSSLSLVPRHSNFSSAWERGYSFLYHNDILTTFISLS